MLKRLMNLFREADQEATKSKVPRLSNSLFLFWQNSLHMLWIFFFIFKLWSFEFLATRALQCKDLLKILSVCSFQQVQKHIVPSYIHLLLRIQIT